MSVAAGPSRLAAAGRSFMHTSAAARTSTNVGPLRPPPSSRLAQQTASSSQPHPHSRSVAIATTSQANRRPAATFATFADETPAFPCIDAHEARTRRILTQRGPSLAADFSNAAEKQRDPSPGPEPTYTFVTSGYKLYHHPEPLLLDYGSVLPEFDIAYETWGELNERKDNVILLHTGLSASSHARSQPENSARGWWEDFIGPGKALDTDRFFVICTNVLGSCYGSTGPSSPNPADEGRPYGTRFPILSIFDMVRAQFHLLDHLGIESVYASIGSSMGGMQSLAAAHLEPNRVQRVVSISGCARSGPSSIALRFAQRSVLMSDPNWNRGHYYGPDQLPPHTGMKLARQIATITYRSGPEWEQRFGRKRRRATTSKDADASASKGPGNIVPGLTAETSQAEEAPPALCPDFEIETYIDHQGESFCLKYDANSLIYISKAMDLFDMSEEALEDLDERRRRAHGEQANIRPLSPYAEAPPLTPMQHQNHSGKHASQNKQNKPPRKHIRTVSSPSAHFYLPSLSRGLSRLAHTPTLIIGVQSDILFPVGEQRECAESLRLAGNMQVRYSELDSPTGHDTFLIDENNVGGQIRGFLAC